MSRWTSKHATLCSLVGAVALLWSGTSNAGDKAPLSALPVLPAPHDRTEPPKDYGVPGLVVKEHASAARSYTELAAATGQGYCIVGREFGLRLEATARPSERDQDAHELWRLVEKDGKATFERTRFEVASDLTSAWVKSKTSIELREVARANGVTVWGYRDGSDVVLLSRGADGGRETRPKKDTDDFFDFVSSGCTFGAVRLSLATAKAGSLAQLHGTLPPVGEGKSKVVPQFVVDSTLAKFSRDPEPVLSVRVRLID
jgi:hypothetical protein